MNNETRVMCTQWWADRLQIENMRDKFFQALFPKIHEGMMLTVDHDPCPVLLEALHEAGIECRGVLFSARGIFDSKMRMRIRDHGDIISVKDGYGAPPFVELGDT